MWGKDGLGTARAELWRDGKAHREIGEPGRGVGGTKAREEWVSWETTNVTPAGVTVVDGDETDDERVFALKPMNCPGGILYFKTKQRSYKELPKRVGEFGLVHRHELHGALHGLFRVRCFTQDDAHIFMTREQIPDEIAGVVHLINQVYSKFGFDYFVELSTRPADSMGSDEDWEDATNGLKTALEKLGMPYIIT